MWNKSNVTAPAVPVYIVGGGTAMPTTFLLITLEKGMPAGQEIRWIPTRIVRTPGVLSGKPRIRDRRIRVQDIVLWHEHLNMAVGEIARQYDLEPEDIQAALTYYANNRDEIEEAIRAEDARVADLHQRAPSRVRRGIGG
jgi:uncharacterized protein (DUF433 family)